MRATRVGGSCCSSSAWAFGATKKRRPATDNKSEALRINAESPNFLVPFNVVLFMMGLCPRSGRWQPYGYQNTRSSCSELSSYNSCSVEPQSGKEVAEDWVPPFGYCASSILLTFYYVWVTDDP